MSEFIEELTENLAGWFRATFARYKNEVSAPPPITNGHNHGTNGVGHHGPNDEVEVLPPAPPVIPRDVRIIVKDKADIEVESFAYTIDGGISEDELADAVIQKTAEDAAASDGGTYFVKVEGIASRKALRFPSLERGRPTDSGAMVRGGGGSSWGMPSPSGYGGAPGPYGRAFPEVNPAVAITQALVENNRELMTHIRDTMGVALGSLKDNNKFSSQALHEAHETIRNYDKSWLESRQALELSLDKKHEREMENKRLALSEERKERIFGLVETGGMSLLAKWFGGKAVPDQMKPVIQMLLSAFGDFTPEQYGKLVGGGILNEKQQLAIKELFGLLVQLQEEEKEAAAASAKTNGSAKTQTNGAASPAK